MTAVRQPFELHEADSVSYVKQRKSHTANLHFLRFFLGVSDAGSAGAIFGPDPRRTGKVLCIHGVVGNFLILDSRKVIEPVKDLRRN